MYILILLLCLVLFLLIAWKIRKYDVVNKIPGPTWFETFRFFFFNSTNEGTYNYITSLPEKYGSLVKLWLKPFKPILIISDPKFFQHIVASKEHLERTAMYKLFDDITKNALLGNPDDVSWKYDRKLLGPAFNTKAVSEYALFFNNHTDKIKQDIEMHEGQTIDIQSVIHRFTLGMVVEYLMQDDISEEDSFKMVNTFDRYLEIFQERAFSILKMNDTVFRFCSSYEPQKKYASHIRGTVAKYLEKHRRIKENNAGASGHRSFIDFLLGTDLSYDSKLSHLTALILAGYETTGLTVSFALYELSKRPDVQTKIYDEYLRVVGHAPDARMNFHSIQRMTYTECVVKEVLRMYPPVPLIQRKLNTSLTIDDITIPDNIDLMFSIISLHKLQFDRAEEFDPDRFSPENIKDIPQYGYAPFSLGPKDCIGKRIGMIESKYLLTHIIKNFTLHPAVPERKLEVIGEMTLKSKNGVYVTFKKRK